MAKLKVGDIFVDGGRCLKVTELNPDGTCNAEFVGFEKVTIPNVKVEKKTEEVKEGDVKEDPVAEEKKYLKSDINRLNVFELEQLCETLDIPKGTGKAMKKAIIEKLGL